ncbi:hypothetical protein DFH06DRAFT_1119230 [Mycena polygramma]|nr:hypothetical protein DFH06DRAFT_1119230 [Mycena polygramma]
MMNANAYTSCDILGSDDEILDVFSKEEDQTEASDAQSSDNEISDTSEMDSEMEDSESQARKLWVRNVALAGQIRALLKEREQTMALVQECVTLIDKERTAAAAKIAALQRDIRDIVIGNQARTALKKLVQDAERERERSAAAATISALQAEIRNLLVANAMQEQEQAEREWARRESAAAFYANMSNPWAACLKVWDQGVTEKGNPTAPAVAILLLQRDAIRRKEIEVTKHEIIEKHEAISLCLQAYNDIIFDTQRKPGEGSRKFVMSEKMRMLLKVNDLRYITELVGNPRRKIPDAAKAARDLALGILTPEEKTLCRALVMQLREGRALRNAIQHPKPDRAAVLESVRQIGEPCLLTLAHFLATDPKRIRRFDELPNNGLQMFARSGEYKSAARQRDELKTLKAYWAATVVQLGREGR